MTIHPDASIHPTAVVASGASIGSGCRIGPYCVLGEHVRLGEACVLHAHVVIAGRTTIGPGCVLYPFVALGQPPQDLRYRDEPTELRVGAGTVFREYASATLGTPHGGGVTRIGEGCYVMMNAHIGHDCNVGDRVVMANSVALAGHVEVGSDANIGGLSGVHQFVRIGRGAMIGGLSAVSADVIPFGMVAGERGRLIGLNLIGLKRRGHGRAAIQALRSAFADVFDGGGTLRDRARLVRDRHAGDPLVEEITAFILSVSDRSFTQPPARGA